MQPGDFEGLQRLQLAEAAQRDRAQREELRDDMPHVRRLLADQAALLGTVSTHVQALTAMVRDLAAAALTSDVREIVQELHQVRAQRDEFHVMANSHQVELARYVELYGPLPAEAENGG
jgi:hypothetical protein